MTIFVSSWPARVSPVGEPLLHLGDVALERTLVLGDAALILVLEFFQPHLFVLMKSGYYDVVKVRNNKWAGNCSFGKWMNRCELNFPSLPTTVYARFLIFTTMFNIDIFFRKV